MNATYENDIFFDAQQPASKRTRFSEGTPADIPDTTTPLPSSAISSSSDFSVKYPKAAATEVLKNHIALLHPSIRETITRLGTSYIKLYGDTLKKSAYVNKLTEDIEYIPASARLGFKITGSRRVKDTTDFKTLHDECENMVTESQKNLRNLTHRSAMLETKCSAKATVDIIFAYIRITTKALLITEKQPQNDQIVLQIVK